MRYIYGNNIDELREVIEESDNSVESRLSEGHVKKLEEMIEHFSVYESMRFLKVLALGELITIEEFSNQYDIPESYVDVLMVNPQFLSIEIHNDVRKHVFEMCEDVVRMAEDNSEFCGYLEFEGYGSIPEIEVDLPVKYAKWLLNRKKKKIFLSVSEFGDFISKEMIMVMNGEMYEISFDMAKSICKNYWYSKKKLLNDDSNEFKHGMQVTRYLNKPENNYVKLTFKEGALNKQAFARYVQMYFGDQEDVE